MAYGLSNGHVTDDVTWPPKVLWGSTVGYRSDSLASCFTLFYITTMTMYILWWRSIGRCDVTGRLAPTDNHRVDCWRTMWATKVADSRFTIHDVVCGQLSSCCNCKSSPIRRSADALVSNAASCSMTRSFTCARRWRCKWMRVVCTKGFLIIVNLLFLVCSLYETSSPAIANWSRFSSAS